MYIYACVNWLQSLAIFGLTMHFVIHHVKQFMESILNEHLKKKCHAYKPTCENGELINGTLVIG